jgi:sulfite reductase alpha subunit-like flavoprotein
LVQDEHPLAETHREKLLELGCDNTENGQESYMDYVWRPKRKPAEVISDFGSLSVPIEQVFNLFPWIRPRSFSIASYAPGQRIEIVAALVRYKTIMKEERFGLCSRWFEDLWPCAQVSIRVDRGTMRPEIIPDGPVVLMCAGTGIAPMLSLIHKIALMPVKPLTYLFFGCRKKSADALFLQDLQKLDWLKVFCEGSRDGPKGAAKVYLPNILLQQSALLYPCLLHPQSQWLLSGNSKLPAGVKKALSEIINSSTTIDGQSFVKNLILSERFFSETWS